KCMLEGFGIPVSYGRLREACQTSVDGTSISTLQSLAQTLGLEADEVLIPVDHVLEPEAAALPAIAVTKLPSGMAHFVVVWRARGGRGLGGEASRRALSAHPTKTPADAFRAWAGSDSLLGPLGRQLRALGGGAGAVEDACADPTWRRLAALDAGVRAAGA